MIYQDVYSSIQPPTSMYGLRKQVEQDQLASQQNQIAIQQKARTEQEAKAKALYQSMNQFGGLSDDKQSAMYQTYRQKWESLMPEAKGIFPSVWDSKDPTNKESLGQVISFLEPLVPAEEYTLSEGQVRIAQRPGGKPTVVARGGEKGGAGFQIKTTVVGDTLIETPENILPSGNILRGPFVYDQFDESNAMPKEKYFKLYPSERPKDIRPESQNKLNATPQAVPNQTELPPRNFNAPSTTNRAGETNVGFPIDENAMMQQPQIMPTMGNMMLRGAGAVMADEFAPQPRNALVGGMMPQPSQFAELMPAGSTPNRFGSPGVEGIDFAATGAAQPQIVNGRVVYTARPKPGEAKETARDMTAEEILASGRDPAEFSGQITSLGQKKFDPIPLKGYSKTQLDKMLQELENLRANAKTEAQKEDVARKEKLFVLRNLKQYEYTLQKLENNPMFDTGPLDQFVTAQTPLGQQIVELGTRIEPIVRKVQRTPGDPAASSETASFGEMLPKLNKYLQNNFDNLNFITQYYLDLYGANAMVNTKAEYDALYSPDQDIVYIDLRDGKRYVKPKGKK
jgi:hypothetical protein